MNSPKGRGSRKEKDRAPVEKNPTRRRTPATHSLTTETSPSSIPRGIEVLVKKASVDPAFLGKTAVMLTALGTITLPTGCATKGNDADRDYLVKKELEAPADDESGDDSEG